MTQKNNLYFLKSDRTIEKESLSTLDYPWASSFSKFLSSRGLKDCPSGHWQVGRPLPQGFPGRSPHCLLSMIDPGVKVLPSLHEQETLMPAPQGLFGLFNTRDLSRSLISLAVGIFCWFPSGHVQVAGGLQSPQGPFRPLPWNRPCPGSTVVPSAQVQVDGLTPAPHGFKSPLRSSLRNAPL